MAYIYTEFDGVDLPAYNWRQDHSTWKAQNTIMRTLNGAFDFYQPQRVITGEQVFQITGLIDSLPAVDNLRALKNKVGVLGQLYRADSSGGEVQKLCRLLQVQWNPTARDPIQVLQPTLTFSTTQPFFVSKGSRLTGGGSLSSGANALYPAIGGDELILGIYMKFTRTSGTVTRVDIESADTGGNIYWAGTGLTGTDYIEIDTTYYSVKRNGSDDYASLGFNSGHADPFWFSLAPGVTNTLTVTVTGGGGTFYFDYLPAFA